MTPLISLHEVRKSFLEGKVFREVLHGLTLSLEPGELVALVGPSGSGKSTLLQLMGALDWPTSGRIEFEGRSIQGLDERALTWLRNRKMGFIFQFHHLLPEFTAAENVMLPDAARVGRFNLPGRQRALHLLAQVGLEHKADVRVDTLSGGQKQRVAVARALVNGPALVLADEPTGNLDRETGLQVIALLERVNRETGTTFLICTHDDSLAARCPRRIRLVDGRIAGDERGVPPSWSPEREKI